MKIHITLQSQLSLWLPITFKHFAITLERHNKVFFYNLSLPLLYFCCLLVALPATLYCHCHILFPLPPSHHLLTLIGTYGAWGYLFYIVVCTIAQLYLSVRVCSVKLSWGTDISVYYMLTRGKSTKEMCRSKCFRVMRYPLSSLVFIRIDFIYNILGLYDCVMKSVTLYSKTRHL